MSEVIFGLDTFGDVPVDDEGAPVSHARAIRQLVDEAVLADQLGVDVFTVGEHHRPEYSVSAPETVLAGMATRTSRIRLGSGVTVLSSDDPVRVFQRFATVDALSNGRAEVILGRGSFTESFPLFGYDLKDYDVLFEEKIELFARLLDEKPVTWKGTMRAPLVDADVYPKTAHGLKTWVGVGGTPQSVVRTAKYGFPLMLAIIGGQPERFQPFIDLYERAAADFDTTAWPVGMHSPGFIADTDDEAKEIFWPHYKGSGTASEPSAAGRPSAAKNSRPKPGTARCTSAHQRPSPGESPAPWHHWTSAASTSSSHPEPSRSVHASKPSNSTGAKWCRWSAKYSPAAGALEVA
jgi:probable LLM family oxidoreductase